MFKIIYKYIIFKFIRTEYLHLIIFTQVTMTVQIKLVTVIEIKLIVIKMVKCLFNVFIVCFVNILSHFSFTNMLGLPAKAWGATGAGAALTGAAATLSGAALTGAAL